MTATIEDTIRARTARLHDEVCERTGRPVDFWPGSELTRFRLSALRMTVAQAKQSVYYRDRLTGPGTTLTALEEFATLPVTPISDVRNRLRDLLAVPMREIAQISTSSGTTGGPTMYVGYTQEDLTVDSGPYVPGGLFPVTADDLAFVVLPYDMVTVGLLLHGDLIRRGVTVFPAGKGGAYAPLPRLVNAIHDLRPTVLFTSPSYAFQIHEQYTATFPDEPHRFTRLWVAGEGASPALLRRLGRLWGADVRQRYGCTEIGPIAYTCEHGDYHQTAANCYLEVTDDAGRPVPAGEPGLITLTTLGRVGTPFVRFQPGDRGVLPKGPCACGRTMPRFRVLSRQTDMLPGERGPVAVFDVENVLFETIGNASPWYRIELSDDGATLVAEEPDGGVPDGAEQAVIDAVLSRTGLAITVRWLATGGFGRPSRKVSRVADLRTGA